MKKNKSIFQILIIALIGAAAVIGAAVYGSYLYSQSTEGKTPQEIAETEIEPVDINTASAEELDRLPGLTPKHAQLIIDYRNEHGRFETIEDVINIKGVGEKLFEQIEPYITAK